MIGARPLEGDHSVGRHSHEVYCGAHLVEGGVVPCWLTANIGVQEGYGACLLASEVGLNDMPVVRQQEL